MSLPTCWITNVSCKYSRTISNILIFFSPRAEGFLSLLYFLLPIVFPKQRRGLYHLKCIQVLNFKIFILLGSHKHFRDREQVYPPTGYCYDAFLFIYLMIWSAYLLYFLAFYECIIKYSKWLHMGNIWIS